MRTAFSPWQVWWIDLDPAQGREQAKRRPAVIVSTAFHLELTRGALVTVLPLTTVERAWAWRPEIQIPEKPNSWAITEQIRTVSTTRISGNRPLHTLTPAEVAAIRPILKQMINI
jgi:mRNA interferase MazF